MKKLECMAVVLRPTEKFLVWINGLPNAEVELSRDDICADCTAVLIPVFKTKLETEEYLRETYLALFNNELHSWDQNRANWPTDMTFENFLEMFDLKFHTLVYTML
ncbi:MAG: hypothetical protein ABIH77_00350 [Pseudomonadota bacterium]|nr:hypothetical protein [Gammaproteobacteria bacterium]MBU1628864.1 hypothetical protein [Gammaproteobacteria bacterium]MBU2546273.1 hypothetical protein [Gammaproteobacteria bacterium]